MAQIKTFDDMINCEPKLKLGELIQLFLMGNDDKIYINIQYIIKRKCRSYVEDLFENIRIIDPALVKYYDCYIEELTDSWTIEAMLTDVIKMEDANE